MIFTTDSIDLCVVLRAQEIRQDLSSDGKKQVVTRIILPRRIGKSLSLTTRDPTLHPTFRLPSFQSHLLPGPALVPHRCPIVVVFSVSSGVHHSVVGGRAAEILASRPAARSAGRETSVRLVHGSILPIDLAACTNQAKANILQFPRWPINSPFEKEMPATYLGTWRPY